MESIEILNQRLNDYFGHDDLGRPIWRLVWSDTQFEKRLTNYTLEGLELITPIVMELPKYSYIKERYVLERLVIVPEFQQNELPVEKISYEPMWTFESNKKEFLYPKWEACKHIIDTIYLAIGKSVTAKYKDPDSGKSPKELIAEEAERVKQIQQDLYGNETSTGDALAHNEGVSYAGLDGRPNKVN